MVTFHRLAPRLTRIELSLDISPHGPIEKIGRGMRFTKRAVRDGRQSGERADWWSPSEARACIRDGLAVGGAVAATVYRALRS